MIIILEKIKNDKLFILVRKPASPWSCGVQAMERRTIQIAVIAIIGIIVLVGAIYYVFIQERRPSELLVYVYDSFMAYGEEGDAKLDQLIKAFEEQYNINVTVKKFESAQDAYNAVVNEKELGKKTADVLIGITPSLAADGKARGLFEKISIDLSKVNNKAISILDPEGYVIPIDYSYLAIIVDTDRIDVDKISLEDFASSPELASKFIVINPTTSGTGLEFLLWQYAYYEYVLHQNWTTWWESILDKAYVAPSWSEAFDIFFGDENRPIMVSYATDPAYSYYFYQSTNLKAFVSEHNGNYYGWMYVEGVAVIKGTENIDAAKLFVEYLLSEEFQKEIPLNNWMYPVIQVDLPEAYDYALDVSNVIPLNDMIPIETLDSLKEYLTTEWLKIVQG